MTAGSHGAEYGGHPVEVSQTAWASGHANNSVQGSGYQVNVFVPAPPGPTAFQPNLTKEVKEESAKMLREEHDEVLGILIGAHNKMKEAVEEGTWVILNARGSLISGELLPAWQWFTEQAELHGEDTFFAILADNIKKAHDKDMELLKKEPEDLTRDEHFRLWDPPIHIHLRNARNFLPEPVPMNGYYWRGRIDEISGWSLGRLASNE